MAISLSVTEDKALIKSILGLPEIWDRFSDGVEFESFDPNLDDQSLWLLVNEGQYEIIGLIFVEMDTSCSVLFHPYLRDKKLKYGRDTVYAFYQFFDEIFPAFVCKIHAVIPTCYQSAINCAKKTGFQVEGVSKGSYLNHGKLFDRVFLGITREEAKHERHS